jgi:hypothetical protein
MIWGRRIEAFQERTAMGQAPHLAHFISRSFVSGIAPILKRAKPRQRLNRVVVPDRLRLG